MSDPERLQKIIARAGIASRRKAEELIRAGRVRVNGAVVRELGASADADVDRIEIDGRPIAASSSTTRLVLLMHKPRSTMCTHSDPEGRPTVFELLDPGLGRLLPVGRLDYGSEGALLLTNDGAIAQALTHPRHAVPKVYEVKLQGRLTPDDTRRLEEGMLLDGTKTQPAVVEEMKQTKTGKATWYRVVLTEGHNRQIRRMLEALHHRIQRLRLMSVGPIELGDLRAGAWRPLEPGELRALEQATGAGPQRKAPARKPRVRDAGVPETPRRGGRSR